MPIDLLLPTQDDGGDLKSTPAAAPVENDGEGTASHAHQGEMLNDQETVGESEMLAS